MITVNAMNAQRNPNCAAHSQGFALIATISVMVLLVMVCLAMLSLTTIELRGKSNTIHQQVAQTNARMAAMLAVAELQRKLGADRRVSATAEIVGDSVHANKQNWTTAWDTSNWDPTAPETTRDEAYLGALVSGAEFNQEMPRGAALGLLSQSVDPSSDIWELMVGEGTVADTDDHVYAPRVSIMDENDVETGSYGWWVGDLGVKARVDVAAAENSPINTWMVGGKMAIPSGSGAHKITGLETYEEYLPAGANFDDLDKFLSQRTLDVSSLDEAVLKENYHSLTTAHTGLLVDNRLGGVRRDLSLAFEAPIEVFNALNEFSNGEERNSTEEYTTFGGNVTSEPLYYHNGTDEALGYLYQVPITDSSILARNSNIAPNSRYRGPTWDVLRNYYRIYKKERNGLNFRGLPTPSTDALIAHGVMPLSYTGSIGDSQPGSSLGGNYSPSNRSGNQRQAHFVSAFGATGGHDGSNGNRIQPTVQKITPEVIRMVIVYGLARIENQFYFTLTPYCTFHNPYNYPLEFHSLSFDMRGLEAITDFRLDYTDTAGNQRSNQEVKFQESSTTSLRALISFRLANPSGQLHRMEPGEIKIMSMEPTTGIRRTNTHVIGLTKFGYSEDGGLATESRTAADNVFAVQPNSQMKMRYRHLNPSTLPAFFARLYQPERATGGAYALDDLTTFSAGTTLSVNRHRDNEPVELIKHARLLPFARTLSGNDERTFNENQLTDPDSGYLPLYVMDINMKTFTDDIAVLADFNYRSLGLDPRDIDTTDEFAANWNFNVRPIGDYSELQLTDDVGGTAYWGPSHEAGSGEPNIVLFDLPYGPSVSLATLQHADTTKLSFHRMRSIGNSLPQVGQDDLTELVNQYGKTRNLTEPKLQIDTSWAANESLWDRYFYSGINWGNMSGQTYAEQSDAVKALQDGDANLVFANPRVTMLKSLSDADVNELNAEDAYTKIANYIGIKGAFNVNSVNVDAWKAVLASLSGREINFLTGTSFQQDTIDGTPLTRFATPADEEGEDYSGFRALSDNELDDLAEAIVEQVKMRGPFMGLSDFVNRRLMSDETGEAGAIQAAIEEANINNSVAGLTTSTGRFDQSAGHTNAGIATYVDQGDVLTPLAPIMATRSDTFVIRAYGDSRDSDGNIRATAWCEIVVQRTPDWIESTDIEATRQRADYPAGNPTDSPILRQWESNSNLPDNNQSYGRKFEVQSFRWLSRDEV